MSGWWTHRKPVDGMEERFGFAADAVPDDERRDYDEVERQMIRDGDTPGAKVRWHERTGR